MARDVYWQASAAAAQLTCGSLHAWLDVFSPGNGVGRASYGGAPLAESSFLGVELAHGNPAVVAEWYRRGGDCIAKYAQTDERPFAVVVYWRAGILKLGETRCPHVDLVVSVETSLLDSRPALAAKSRVSLVEADEVVGEDHVLRARFGKANVTFAEMCHPQDALAPSIETVGDRASWTTWLFGHPLEKGVILRSRLRGVFLPLKNDAILARLALADFAVSAAPLTT